jgi:FixJ family two-component response regulator
MGKVTSLIAVVDDEESVRKALGRLIRAAGFEVVTYSSGADFLRSIRQRRPHCVVLDLRMPWVNGFDVQSALLQAEEQLPIVIITGDDSPESRLRALKQGAKAYLRKPVDDAILLDAIQSAMRSAPPPKT